MSDTESRPDHPVFADIMMKDFSPDRKAKIAVRALETVAEDLALADMRNARRVTHA